MCIRDSAWTVSSELLGFCFFLIFFVSVPCAILSRRSRQLYSACKSPIDNMHQKFGKDRTCSSRDILAEKQIHRHSNDNILSHLLLWAVHSSHVFLKCIALLQNNKGRSNCGKYCKAMNASFVIPCFKWPPITSSSSDSPLCNNSISLSLPA